MEKRGHWRASRRLLLGVFLAWGLALLAALPPFEGWDEYQHVAYVVHLLDTGEAPVYGEAQVSEALLRKVVGFPGADLAEAQLGRVGQRTYAAFWRSGPLPTYLPPDPPLPLYQAQHDPLSYRLLAPLFAAAGGVEALPASAAVLRLANLLLGAAAVWVLLGCIGRQLRRDRDRILLGLLIVLQPLFSINFVRVSNDALGVLLATLVFVAVIELRSDRLLLRCAALGVLASLALRAKELNLALLPFVGLALPWKLWRLGLSGRRVTAALVLCFACLGLATLPKLYDNYQHLGSLTSVRDLLEAQRAGLGPGAWLRAASEINWPGFTLEYWGRESLLVAGWSFFKGHQLARELHLLAVLVMACGGLFLLRRPSRGRPWICASPDLLVASALLLACFHAALCTHLLLMQQLWDMTSTNIWYAAAALPAWLVLLYQGAAAWPLPLLPTLLGWGLAALFAATSLEAVFLRMLPYYTGTEAGAFSPALARLALLQPAWLGTPTLLLATTAWLALLALLVFRWSRELPYAEPT